MVVDQVQVRCLVLGALMRSAKDRSTLLIIVVRVKLFHAFSHDSSVCCDDTCVLKGVVHPPTLRAASSRDIRSGPLTRLT